MRNEGFLSRIARIKESFVRRARAPCQGVVLRHVLFSGDVDKVRDALV